MSKESARTYRARLSRFCFYVYKTHGRSLDDLIADMVNGSLDPYDLLSSYVAYLKVERFRANEIREKTKTAKRFLFFAGVEKAQIIDLLDGCKNQRLRTALLMYASTGCRALEACSIKLSDVDLVKGTITFPAEVTKTRTERTRLITKELANQITTWLKIKVDSNLTYRPWSRLQALQNTVLASTI